MRKYITRQSMTCFIATALYAVIGLASLSGGTIASIIIALFLFAGAIGAYYKNTELLDLCLFILVIVALTCLIFINPLDPDLHAEELDEYKESFNSRTIITICLYTLLFIYFYCLNSIRKFPTKHIIAMFLCLLLVTLMIIYLRN